MKRSLAALLMVVCLLTSCAPRIETANSGPSAEPAPEKTVIFAMDTVMELTVYGDPALLEQAKTLILDLECKLSVTDESSEIYAVNQTGFGNLSPDTARLLSDALDLCERTQGALDISIYPVVRAWGFTTGSYQVPSAGELQALLANVDYSAIKFNAENASIHLGEGMEIDLGSVAKGYTGDRVIELLRENGVTSALLNLGGNVQALGAKPDGSPWLVAIQDPVGDSYLGSLKITGKAVITSGGYERFFEQDGHTYWHIIDPSTGAPAENGLISVTIVGETGVTCDGLSTALFVMGLDDAVQLWQKSGDFDAVFVSAGGAITITEGLEDSFTPLDNYADAEVTVVRRG